MINLSNIKLNFTHAANKKIYQLINKNINLNFRIYILGGGCNGFQYQFKLDNKINHNDIIIKRKYNIIIDSISIQYIYGGIIDYKETLEGAKFIVFNPNAKTTCSCGASFSV